MILQMGTSGFRMVITENLENKKWPEFKDLATQQFIWTKFTAQIGNPLCSLRHHSFIHSLRWGTVAVNGVSLGLPTERHILFVPWQPEIHAYQGPLIFGLPNGHGHVSVGKGAGVKGTGSDYFLSIELRNEPQSRFHKCAETELTTAQNGN